MGSGASGLSYETPGGDVRLPVSGLRFSIHQLRALNSYVDSLYAADQKGRMTTETESAVESLVQRIVDGAGQRDPRFRCCHLTALHWGKKMRSRSLEYLVTLDSLPVLNSSEDCHLQDGPVGYGKIRLSGREAEKWEEFVTPSGYLCRDKVIERWVELIARCATARGGGGSRVLCARAAPRAQPYHYCYLERATAPQVSQERQLAIVEGAAWVMVRVGAGEAEAKLILGLKVQATAPQVSQERRLAIVEGAAWVMVRVGAGEAEAKLMLGVKVQGCNPAAYTTRMPLTHPLALLHYSSAQGGYYAAAVGPPSSIVCAERASTWQLWHPALEATLDAHCSELSPVARIAGALNRLIDRMREGGYQGSLKVLSRYAASCALRRRLDRCAAYAQSAARCVVSSHIAHHLLFILDSLLSICERGGTAGYVYPVERGSVIRRGARDTDWASDAACVRSCLLHLQQIAGEDIPPTPSESLEIALFNRWENLNKVWKSSSGPAPSYTRRQLRYLWRVAAELVICKNMVVVENHSNFRANLIQATSLNQEAVEDLIHILAIMLDQARDLYLNNFSRNFGEFDRELSAYRTKKWNKLKDYYDASSACLIDAVRRDPDLRKEDLTDPLNVMKQVLNWLHKGAKDDKKYLGPVLKPYLDGLFAVSIENSWFLDDFDARKCEKEFQGLKDYCVGVHDGAIEPCMGLLDVAKKYAWAKAMVDFVDRFKHVDFRLVFPTGEGMAISYPIKLPSRREHSSARLLTLSRRDKAEAKLRLARRCVLGAFADTLIGDRCIKPRPVSRQGSEEILNSVKNGNFLRTSKPDIIPATSASLDTLPRSRRRSRRTRSTASYGFPEISITSQSDTKTMRRKYHTLRSLVYTEPVESIKEMRQRPRSAGSTVRNKAVSRPSLLETLDFINSVKDALCVEESGVSDTEDSAWCFEDEWLVGQMAPLNLLAARSGLQAFHLALGELVPALLHSGKFTVLQELCAWLGDSSEGALFALHRLARAARSRSSERSTTSWRLPEGISSEAPQKYKSRPPDYISGDEAPQPPPLPRQSSREKMTKRHSDYLPPKRLQDLEQHLDYLEKVNSRLNLTQNQKQTQNQTLNENYTGIINPIYDIKIPKDKFSVKRSKSLGRSFSTKHGLDITRYNITLGRHSGKKTNDVVTAIDGTTGETGLDPKSNFFQRYSTANVVGDSYKVSRVSID